jgi:hypothetical protein
VFILAGLKIEDSWAFEPLLIALAAAIGAATEECSGHLLGFGSRKSITENTKTTWIL